MKILIPLDGSARSEATLSWAPCFLDLPEARLHLLHVAPDERGTARHSAKGKPVRCEEYAHETGRRIGEADRVRTHTLVGDPALNIVRFAMEQRIDWIAMCTRCKRGLSRALFGSVTEAVLRRSLIPLFVVGPSVRKPEGAPALRRVLVPLDGSLYSAGILRHIPGFARLFQSEVTLFHVHSGRRADIETRLMGWADDLGRLGIPSRYEIAQGDPRLEIVERLLRSGEDLVAMSTHGRSEVTRLLLGSVAEEVILRSPCPVLLHRSR